MQIRHPSTDKIKPTPTDTPDTPEEAGAEPVSKLRHWNQDKKFRLSGDRKVRPSRTASGSPGTNSSSELRDFFFLMAPENVSKEKKLESWDRSVKTSKRVSGGGQGRDVESRAARAGAQTNAGRDEAEYSADDDDDDVPVTGSPQRTERPSGEELASAFGVTAASGRARCPFGFDMLAAAADEVLEVSCVEMVRTPPRYGPGRAGVVAPARVAERGLTRVGLSHEYYPAQVVVVAAAVVVVVAAAAAEVADNALAFVVLFRFYSGWKSPTAGQRRAVAT